MDRLIVEPAIGLLGLEAWHFADGEGGFEASHHFLLHVVFELLFFQPCQRTLRNQLDGVNQEAKVDQTRAQFPRRIP